jgi:hypothetical protein
LLDRCLLVNPTPDDGFFNDLALLNMIGGAHDSAATYFELVADPSTWGVIYKAVNAELAGHGAPRLSQAARERIAEIWPQEREMDDEAVVQWVSTHHPFRSPEVEERFLNGVRMMLESASSLTTPV